jgi:hypothetical protein
LLGHGFVITQINSAKTTAHKSDSSALARRSQNQCEPNLAAKMAERTWSQYGRQQSRSDSTNKNEGDDSDSITNVFHKRVM